MTTASAQQKPTTGYAPVNGLKMYYEVHGPDKPGFGKRGEPVVLLHGAFMTITNNWDAPNEQNWIGELAKTRRVIAVEMQGHGWTADVIGRWKSTRNGASPLSETVSATLPWQSSGDRVVRGR